MYAKKNSGKKIAAILLAIILLIGCAVGGTIAWLMDTSATVTNTFSVGNIDIELKETVEADSFKILPGTEQTKDPVVTVKENSEDCYVFLQVEEVNNEAAKDSNGVVTHKYVTWEIDPAVWTKLNENGNITTYYATANYTGDAAEDYNVLSGTKVTYRNSLTKEMIDKLYTAEGAIDTAKQPKLNFKAFAVQKEAGNDAAAAWSNVPVNEHLGTTT